MRAIHFTEHGGYDRLQLIDLPKPQPQDGQVLVRITAASITPADNVIRLGKMPFVQRLPHIPGVSGAGVIEQAGASSLPIGTPVIMVGMYGFQNDGTWREYMAVPPYEVTPLPDTLTAVEAAGLNESYLTAYAGLVQGGFQAGQRVLIPAVGGGVGNAAVQLARVMNAAQIITTAGTHEKAEKARSLGYQNVIDLSHESLSARVRELTNGEGVHLAVDSVGGNITGQALASLARRGTLSALGYSGGVDAMINLTDLLWKGARIVSASPTNFTPDELKAAARQVLAWAAEGRIKPEIARTFTLEQAAEAQRYLIEERPFGKVILTLA